jgi:hypothetical protein
MGRTYTEAQRRRNIEYQRAYRAMKAKEDKEWKKKESERTKVKILLYLISKLQMHENMQCLNILKINGEIISNPGRFNLGLTQNV